MNYERITDGSINWSVAEARGLKPSWSSGSKVGFEGKPLNEYVDYCNNKEDCRAIISEHKIAINRDGDMWEANNGVHSVLDSNPYRAAMLCFLDIVEANNED